MAAGAVNCWICGDVELTPAVVTVTTRPDGSGWYSFQHCGTETRREATPAIVALLATGGVRARLTEDDVMDAVVWLEQHDPSEEMA